MDEFRIAYSDAVKGKRKKLLIPVKLSEDIPDSMIDEDLNKYMKMFTYAEVNDMKLFRKKLLFGMPKYPLRYGNIKCVKLVSLMLFFIRNSDL